MKKLLLSGALLVALALPAQAAQVTVTNVVGTWTDVDPNGAASGVGTSQIKWGTPAGSGGQSSYTFTSNVPPPQVLGDGAVFDLANFTHNNQPITGNSITGATLDVAITFTSDFFAGSQIAHSLFTFAHNETPNACLPLPGCANDIVTATLNLGTSSIYHVNGHDLTFGVTGFQVGQNVFAQFSSPEGTSNSAMLRASFTDVGTFAVPGPIAGAGLPGLVAACGGLVAFARRRRQVA